MKSTVFNTRFINNILTGKKSVLMTYPDMPDGCTRDYVYVGDVVRANGMAAEKPVNGVVNIGAGVEIFIGSIYRTMEKVYEVTLGLEVIGPRTRDIKRSVLDAAKAQEV